VQNSTVVFQLNISNNIGFCASISRPNAKPRNVIPNLRPKIMAKYQYKLTCNLKINPDTFLAVADNLEISLPCINCQRNHRTIIFESINNNGVCTPRAKCNGFLGNLISIEILKEKDKIKINYLIEFDYQPFFDLKYKVESDFKFGWARIYFFVKCSQCQTEKKIYTQENISRPRIEKCECGNILFKDEKSPFKYKATEIN